MNWLLIVTAGILITGALLGYRRGMVKTILNLLLGVITLVLVMFFSPRVCDFLQTQTSLPDYMYDRVETVIWEKIDEQSEDGQFSLEGDGQDRLIDSLPFSGLLSDTILESETLNRYAQQGLDLFVSYISRAAADSIVVLIGYIATFLAVFLILRVAVLLLNIIQRLPILHGLNKLIGLGLGLLEGLLAVWILGILLTVFATTDLGRSASECINQSSFLASLYGNNLLQQLIFWMAG